LDDASGEWLRNITVHKKSSACNVCSIISLRCLGLLEISAMSCADNCGLSADPDARTAGNAVESSDDSDSSSLDSATRRSRAAAALVQDYGDMAQAPASSCLPSVKDSFQQVRMAAFNAHPGFNVPCCNCGTTWSVQSVMTSPVFLRGA
jgi:hypothetical protein